MARGVPWSGRAQALAQFVLAAAAAPPGTGSPDTPVRDAMTEIRASTVLPAVRKPITLRTADGLNLVGALALPEGRPPAATLICLHPLPTAGGMMASPVLRKASYRLPALADLAVLRFNNRGTTSEQGTNDG